MDTIKSCWTAEEQLWDHDNTRRAGKGGGFVESGSPCSPFCFNLAFKLKSLLKNRNNNLIFFDLHPQTRQNADPQKMHSRYFLIEWMDGYSNILEQKLYFASWTSFEQGGAG